MFISNAIVGWGGIGLGCVIATAIVANVVKKHIRLKKGQYSDIIITGIVVYPVLNVIADKIFSYFVDKWIAMHMSTGTIILPIYFDLLPSNMTVFVAVIVALMSTIALYTMQRSGMRKEVAVI